MPKQARGMESVGETRGQTRVATVAPEDGGLDRDVASSGDGG